MQEHWEKLIINFLKDFFRRNGITHKNYENTALWLSRYFNFRLRFIQPKGWQLRVSKELSGKLNSHPAKEACFDIFFKASNGKNLNPYQSKGLRSADVHDGLYNDWGIHHLHLSTTKQPSMFFYDRSDYLLLIRFEDDTAYFIDIFLHKEKHLWSLTDCIRILQTNWPELLAHYETPGMTFTPNLNDEEIGILRKKGYTFGINVDDKSYMMLNHGYATSGDNMMAGRLGDEIIRWGHANRLLATGNEKAFLDELKSHLWLS